MILALPFRDAESNFLISSAPRRHTLSWNGRPMKIEALASIANGRSMRNLWNFDISLNCTFEFHAQSLKFLTFTDCPNCNTPTTFLKFQNFAEIATGECGSQIQTQPDTDTGTRHRHRHRHRQPHTQQRTIAFFDDPRGRWDEVGGLPHPHSRDHRQQPQDDDQAKPEPVSQRRDVRVGQFVIDDARIGCKPTQAKQAVQHMEEHDAL